MMMWRIIEMNITSLPLDLEIGYYHVMSSMAQLRRGHVNESSGKKDSSSLQILKAIEDVHPILCHKYGNQSSVKAASA